MDINNNTEEKKNEDIQCAICLDDETNKDKEFKVLDCEHKFHTICVEQVINNLCPLCRQIIDKDKVNNDSTENIYNVIPDIIEDFSLMDTRSLPNINDFIDNDSYLDSMSDYYSDNNSDISDNSSTIGFNNDWDSNIDWNSEVLNTMEQNNQTINNNYELTTIISVSSSISYNNFIYDEGYATIDI